MTTEQTEALLQTVDSADIDSHPLADMTITEAAKRYIALHPELQRSIAKEPLYSVNRFVRVMGDLTLSKIKAEQIAEFRVKAETFRFSKMTVRSAIGDVRTIIIDMLKESDQSRKPMPDVEGESDDPSNLSVRAFAVRYTKEQDITRREAIYSANRFTKLLGPMRVNAITTETLVEFRAMMKAMKLSPATIEGAVSDIRTLVKASTGVLIETGRRLKLPRPEPKPVDLKTLEASWPFLHPGIQQWAVLSYWTALRFSDAMSLQLTLTETIPDALQWRASKTGHLHRWPVPQWLRPWLVPKKLPYRKTTDFWRKTIRHRIAEACELAGVKTWKPKFLRQFALTQWMRTNSAAGQIVHGCGLNGVLKHYIDPLTILEEAADKMFVPEFFLIGEHGKG